MGDYALEVDGVNFIPHNILVTGGCGFIGSHVVIHLAKNFPHYNIINFDKLDYCSSLKTLEEVENLPNYKFVKGDILSEDFVNYVITSNNVDTIMHFAAQTHVDNSFGNSIEFTKNNVLGTHVLLEIAKQLKIKRFIHVSTDEVYGEKAVNDDSAIETSVLEPTNPYAASKAGAEHIVKSYYKSFKLPVIITRGNNVFGPHQFPEKIIPKFISLLSREKPCCIHGDGSHRRSYIYIDDVVRAFDTILHKGHIGIERRDFVRVDWRLGEVYNIGTDFEISNMDLALKLLEKFGFSGREKEFIQYFEDRPFNDIRYHIDTSKLNKLGWKPKIDFSVGLDKTIVWYKKNFDIWEGIAELALVPHPTTKLWRTSVNLN